MSQYNIRNAMNNQNDIFGAPGSIYRPQEHSDYSSLSVPEPFAFPSASPGVASHHPLSSGPVLRTPEDLAYYQLMTNRPIQEPFMLAKPRTPLQNMNSLVYQRNQWAKQSSQNIKDSKPFWGRR